MSSERFKPSSNAFYSSHNEVKTDSPNEVNFYSHNEDENNSHNEDFEKYSNEDGSYNPFKHIYHLIKNISSVGCDARLGKRNIYAEGLNILSQLYAEGGFNIIKKYYENFFRKFQDHAFLKKNSPIDLLLICGDIGDEIAFHPRYERLLTFENGLPSYYSAAIITFQEVLGQHVPAWIGFYSLYLLSMVN